MGTIDREQSSITREQAWQTLNKYVHAEHLIRHALAVEGVMRRYAVNLTERSGEIHDPEVWGVIGLCHDIDYERYPDRHCEMAFTILSDEGWPEAYIRAVQSHGWGICSPVEPLSLLEKVLFTIDELTGLVAAAAVVRPSRSVLDLEVKSVRKKWNTKAFSAGVDRGVIEKGAAMIPMELSEVIAWTIQGMRDVAEEIGLQGSLPIPSL